MIFQGDLYLARAAPPEHSRLPETPARAETLSAGTRRLHMLRSPLLRPDSAVSSYAVHIALPTRRWPAGISILPIQTAWADLYFNGTISMAIESFSPTS